MSGRRVGGQLAKLVEGFGGSISVVPSCSTSVSVTPAHLFAGIFAGTVQEPEELTQKTTSWATEATSISPATAGFEQPCQPNSGRRFSTEAFERSF